MKFTAILFSSLLLGLMMGSCHSGQKVSEGEFLIEGFVKNLPDSSIVSLFQFEIEHRAESIAFARRKSAGVEIGFTQQI